MPELPDVELYVARIAERVAGLRLVRFRIASPFALRSVGLRPADFEGSLVRRVFRIGKRIVLEFEDEKFVVFHLMIAGRFQWQSPPPVEKRTAAKSFLAELVFEPGRLSLVENSTRKRAGIWLVGSREGLDEHRRGGLDLFTISIAEFAARLKSESRTLKRMLTNPSAFDGIGNAYSDEILFAAKLSPIRLTGSLTEEEVERLLGSARKVLATWSQRLVDEYPNFPKPTDITAFRKGFAVHGKFGEPCPVCGSPVQRIVYAENETNYCARCQNEGRLLADRSLSRLLKSDWPATLEEMLEDRPA